MNMHKRTRLTSLDREEIWRLYGTRERTVVALSQKDPYTTSKILLQ